MARKLLIALVVMVGVFIGMERTLRPVAAVEVDFLIVECGETWFKADLETRAKEVYVMVSRAEDGVVLSSKAFPVVENQDARVIFYPKQPDGTLLTISFGEWEYAYLETPIVANVACDASNDNRVVPSFATVTRSPTLMPSATRTPSVTPDMTATTYWLVVTYGPGILTATPYGGFSQPSPSATRTPTPRPTLIPSATPRVR